MAPATDKAIQREFKSVVRIEKYAFAEFHCRMNVHNLPHRNYPVLLIVKHRRLHSAARPRHSRKKLLRRDPIQALTGCSVTAFY